MKIKICGITNIEDALLCESLGADSLGFVFYEGSKRFIGPKEVRIITKRLSPFTARTGVFVNHSLDYIIETAGRAGLNVIQLHGDETPEFAANIPLPVIKSFCVSKVFNFDDLYKYNNVTPLLDTYNVDMYGGSGKKFDWDLIPDDIRSRIILAGGISAGDIGHIKNVIRPYAIDLSSALEKEPGIKDADKTRKFFSVFNEV